MTTTEIVTIMQSIKVLADTTAGIIDAIDKMKSGQVDDVNLEELRKRLLSLPDLPVLNYDQKTVSEEPDSSSS